MGVWVGEAIEHDQQDHHSQRRQAQRVFLQKLFRGTGSLHATTVLELASQICHPGQRRECRYRLLKKWVSVGILKGRTFRCTGKALYCCHLERASAREKSAFANRVALLAGVTVPPAHWRRNGQAPL